MVVFGEGAPKICEVCPNSYWEETCSGYEEAYCGKYEMFCDAALKSCEMITLKQEPRQ